MTLKHSKKFTVSFYHSKLRTVLPRTKISPFPVTSHLLLIYSIVNFIPLKLTKLLTISQSSSISQLSEKLLSLKTSSLKTALFCKRDLIGSSLNSPSGLRKLLIISENEPKTDKNCKQL